MDYTDKKFAFCITVYGGRPSPILDNLQNIDTIFDIYIVTLENDKEKEYYNQFLDKRERIFLLETKARNIQEKRHDIVNYVRWEYDGHFQCDDDLLFYGLYIDETSKNKTGKTYSKKKCDFNLILEKEITLSYEENAALSAVYNIVYLAMQTPNAVGHSACRAVVFIRHDLINEKMINYSPQEEIYEDVDFTLTCLANGLNIAVACDYAYDLNNFYHLQTKNKSKVKSTIFEDDNSVIRYTINTAMKWKLPLYYMEKKKHSSIVLKYKIKSYKDFFDNPNPYDFHDEVIENLYKEKKYDEIFLYLKEKKLKRKEIKS